MPTDPRDADGTCGNTDPWAPPLKPWQTGGSGAGRAVATAGLSWPPSAINRAGDVAALPSYTPTGNIVTLPVPTNTASASSSIDFGNGWANSKDDTKMMVSPSGCDYIDPWIGPGAAVPAACGGTTRREVQDVPEPDVTPAPKV
jgi:glucan 1,3-beta-glucosidase